MENHRSFDASTLNEKVVINVGGQKHETYSNTLRSIPDTRLYWITENPTQLAEYDPNSHEYFFDRHPGVFSQVLNFYRTGKLHCPNDVCGPLFEEELAFWGIDELQVEPCCWLNYKKHREAQAQLDPFESRDSDGESVDDMDMTIYGLVGDSIRRRNRSCWKTYQPKIWTLFEEPYSSRPAQIIAFIILFLIITSVAVFCLETMPYFNEPDSIQKDVIYYIEVFCVVAFTIEFVIRAIVCPNKLAFCKMPMNWIDFFAILPFYLQIMLNKSDIQTMVVFRVIRLIRVFRIFKLSRHSYGLQILGHTLKSSCSELFLLAFFLSIGVVIFSSIIYYAEKDIAKSHFKTIPHGFWWAVVTMTTLGYGDMVPLTWQGKIVGSLCAVSGVLMIALPVPVIVSNFSLYYSHAKARMNLPKRKRPLIFGAASALRVTHPFGGEQNPNVITQLMEEGAGKDDDDPESQAIARRTPRSSGRFSPLPHGRPPRTLYSPTGNLHQPTSRGSMTSPPEPIKSGTLVVPDMHSKPETQEKVTTRRASMVPQPIPQVVLSGSGELSPNDSTPPSKSPVSLRLSDTGSVSSIAEKSDKSPASKKRAIQSKSLSADSSHGSPRGRRGRRGSIYIVGFTAKHWQNKALNKNKSERKFLSADNSTEKDDGRPRGYYHSLSCDACDQRKARSAEVLIRPERSTQSIETKPVEPRRDSVTVQLNPRSVTHKSLTRVSSGTQTSTKSLPSPIPISKASSDTGTLSCNENKQKARKSSNTLLEHSDDSLCVHRHLSQRRGSSPLRRQHAVFTFDVSEQAEGKSLAKALGQVHANMLAPVTVVHQATSPTLPSQVEQNTATTENIEGKNRELPSPPLIEGRRNSGRTGKVRPKSMPVSSYVNASYQKEEDDSLSQTSFKTHEHDVDENMEKEKTIEKENEKKKDSPIVEKRGFRPYRKDGVVHEISTVTPPKVSELLEDDSDKDHYSRGRRTPLGSVSNASLPSISEEQDNNHTSLNLVPNQGHRLHRPQSMPAEVNENFSPSSPSMYRASSVPLNPVGTFETKLMDEPKSLLQRRQGPELSLGNASDQTIKVNQLDVVNYPWFQRILNSSSLLQASDDRLNVNKITSALSPLATGDLPLSADDRLLYSPHTPQLNAPKTRDTATSPFITVWDENEEVPGTSPGVHHSKNSQRQTSSGSLKVDSFDSDSKRSDVELRPITRVEDQAGREYALYAIPTGLDGSVFYSSSSFEEGENTEPQLRTKNNQNRGSHFGLPEEIVREITANSRSSIRDMSGYDRSLENTRDDSRSSGRSRDSSYHSERYRDDFLSSKRTQDDDDHLSSMHNEENNANTDSVKTSASKTLKDTPALGAANGKRNRSPSPRLQRTDHSVIYNGHEPLQPKLSGSLLHTKRPSSLPSPDRRKARMFFGDSGISSVGSGSSASMSHSLDLDVESKERKENAANILNPIEETESENPNGRRGSGRIDPGKIGAVNIMLPSIRSSESTVIDILTNVDIFEASLV